MRNGRLCLALSILALPVPAQSPPLAGAQENELLQRVVVIGASVSAGYGLQQEVEVETDLGAILECLLQQPRHSILVAADNFFFTDPQGFGRRFLDQAKQAQPTLVVALDYLFWFAYGFSATEEARLSELELGLAMLQELSCPILLGDFPEVSQATEGKGPFGQPMIVPAQIPAKETLEKLNQRLLEWSQERGGVSLVPMTSFLDRLRLGEALRIRDNVWPENSLRLFLQEDLLHPTLEGSLALGLLCVDSLAANESYATALNPIWEVKALRERFVEHTAAEREKARAAERRREERRKAREERKDSGGGENQPPRTARARQETGSRSRSTR